MNPVAFAFLLTLSAGLFAGVGGLIAIFAKDTNRKFLSVCLSFSAGVMIYLSFTEIFLEAYHSLSYVYGSNGLLFAVLGFFGGMGIIGVVDKLIPQEDASDFVTDKKTFCRQDKKDLKRVGIFSAVAIAKHNLLEGVVTFMAAIHDPALGIAIAIAIAIHNIPEGIAVAVPIKYATGSKLKAVSLAFASGLTEPLGGLIAYLFFMQVFYEGLFGILFASVGGVMIYISFHTLLPTAAKYGEHSTVMKGLFSGMAVMAVSLLFI